VYQMSEMFILAQDRLRALSAALERVRGIEPL
jgi:hypothetical protein